MGRRKKERQGRDGEAAAKSPGLIKGQSLLWRTLAYAFPFKSLIFVSMLLAMIASAMGAFSVLPMIPVIEMVISPDEVKARSERAAASMGEKEARLDRVDAITGEAEKKIGGMIGEFVSVEQFQLELSAAKDRMRVTIYDYLQRRKEDAIYMIVAFLLIATIIKSAVEYQSKYLMTKVVFLALQDMKLHLYKACLDLDMVALQSRTSGNLISRLSADIIKVRSVFQASLSQSFLVPFEFLALLAVMIIISPQITLITAIGLPLVVVPITLLSRKLRTLSKHDAEEDAKLVDVMQETLHGMVIVKAFGSERMEKKRFREVSRGQLRRQIRRSRLSLAAPAVVDVLTMAAMGGVLIAGAYLVVDAKTLTAAELVVYLFVLTRFYKPLKLMTNGIVKIQRGLASCERIFEIVDAQPMVKEKPDAIELGPFEDRIVFDNVSFGYDPTRDPVLREFSLVVPKGQRVALVGSSGSGKSTVTRLLPRFYDPASGTVSVDGIDLRDVTFASLRSQIAVVTQETILFDATIFENISYGRPGATHEEVEQAGKDANAHDFITKLPDGYHSRIGERGGELSGGQRQRIAIARALLRNSPILILDEATSALDTESEAVVQQALERLMSNRTVLVIAHRLSTIREADKIVVLEAGTVVEQGTHDQLLAAKGRYYELITTEARNVRSRSAVEAPVDEDLVATDPDPFGGFEERAPHTA